ncbi:MAG: TetR family transcriptional regulator C-terminal domain-containing protein [Spirochaetaceae bacterium]|nr:TetR family transcriptional regulator C-terminal domain-containing protein [Spirochaetaceae bacterium]
MKNNNMKEYILEKGIELVAENGFKNTGISEILKTASIPKGSFYYYFDSKTDFGIQLINYAARSFFSSIEPYFAKEIPPMERIENFFGEQISHFQGSPCSCNCLFGKLSQEITDQDPLFRKKLAEIFEVWKDYFKKTLIEAEGQGSIHLKHNPDALARFILSGWEGALMQGKIHQSTQPLEEFRDIFFSLLSR